MKPEIVRLVETIKRELKARGLTYRDVAIALGTPFISGKDSLNNEFKYQDLAGQSIVGLKPDPKEAALWYERARELGAPEASARLSRLQGK